MSENIVNAALRRLGLTKEQMCGHGFRTSASGMSNKRALFNPDAIERPLADIDNDDVRRACHRADYGDERVKMMNRRPEK